MGCKSMCQILQPLIKIIGAVLSIPKIQISIQVLRGASLFPFYNLQILLGPIARFVLFHYASSPFLLPLNLIL